jgi:hypothetical protein
MFLWRICRRRLGTRLLQQSALLPVSSSQAPIESGYGVHLVYVTKHTDNHLPALTEVPEQVRLEYLDAKRREATDRFYEALLSRKHEAGRIASDAFNPVANHGSSLLFHRFLHARATDFAFSMTASTFPSRIARFNAAWSFSF